jgi:hypothetical protein
MSHDKGLDKTDEEVSWQAWKGRLKPANDGKIRGIKFCPSFVATLRVRFVYEGLFEEREWKFLLP